MRAFIAIELPEKVKHALASLQRRLREGGVRASWARLEQAHLTLRFLGEITDEQARALARALGEAYAGQAAFELRVKGVGAFPHTRRPRVVWAGIDPANGALNDVQAQADATARAVGVAADRTRFRPHVTLGRVREPGGGAALANGLAREAGFSGGFFSVRGVSLFSSELGPTGAVHTRLQEFGFR